MIELLNLTGTTAHQVVRTVLIWTAWPTLAYFVAINAVYLCLVLLGSRTPGARPHDAPSSTSPRQPRPRSPWA